MVNMLFSSNMSITIFSSGLRGNMSEFKQRLSGIVPWVFLLTAKITIMFFFSAGNSEYGEKRENTTYVMLSNKTKQYI